MNTTIMRAGVGVFLRTALSAALAACLCLPAAAGTLYRWVDEKGVVNYSSEPPPEGRNMQTVTQRAIVSYNSYNNDAMLANQQNRELQARLDRLQREVDELRQVRTAAPATPAPAPMPALPQTSAQKVAANPCADDPRNNCSRGLTPEFDYPQIAVVRARPSPLFVVPAFVPVVSVVPMVPMVPVTPTTLQRSHPRHRTPELTATFRPGRWERMQD